MTSAGEPSRFAAVVLAGGTGARLGGLDKAAIEVDGATLLERVLDAAAGAAEVVVVGHPVPTTRPVTWTLEDPPLGGPAAGLLAGLACLSPAPDLVAVLAVDLPRVTAGTVARLVAAATNPPSAEPGAGPSVADGAVLVDAGGRRQTLAAVYRRASLDAAAPADPADRHGLPMRRLVGGLRLAEVPTVGDEARDVDTPEHLDAVRGRTRPAADPPDARDPVARSSDSYHP